MKTSADRKRHKKKTARITKRLEYYKVSGKKRERNIKRKKKMEKKGTWSKKKEANILKRIKEQTLPGDKNWKKPLTKKEQQSLAAQIKLKLSDRFDRLTFK